MLLKTVNCKAMQIQCPKKKAINCSQNTTYKAKD